MFVALRRGEVGLFLPFLRVTCAEQSISFHLKGRFWFYSLFVARVSAAPDSFGDSLAGG